MFGHDAHEQALVFVKSERRLKHRLRRQSSPPDHHTTKARYVVALQQDRRIQQKWRLVKAWTHRADFVRPVPVLESRVPPERSAAVHRAVWKTPHEVDFNRKLVGQE